MTRLIAFCLFAFLLSVVSAHALLLTERIGNATIPTTGCSVVPPAPGNVDGNCILAPGPTGSLTDAGSVVWSISANICADGNDYVYTKNGTLNDCAWQMQLNSGRKLFYQQRLFMPTNVIPWGQWSAALNDWIPATSPTAAAVGSVFVNNTHSTNWENIQRLMSHAVANDTVTIPLMPAGMPAWFALSTQSPNYAALVNSGMTLNCAAGAKLYGAEIDIEAANATVTGCEASYNSLGPSNGPHIGFRIFCNAPDQAGALNATLTNVVAKENDDGIEAACDQQSLTVNNMLMQHNGYFNPSGNCNGFDHNLYLSFQGFDAGFGTYPDRSSVTISGGFSVDQRCSGDPIKIRWRGGTITNFSTGQTGQYASDTNLNTNWPGSEPCGGAYTHSHSVFVRPALNAARGGNYGIMDYGSEWPGNVGNGWNCPGVISFTANTANGSPNLAVTSGYSDSSGDTLTIANIAIGAAATCSAGIPNTNGSLFTVSTAAGTTIGLSGNATSTNTGASCHTTRNHVTTYDHLIMIDDGDSGTGSQLSPPVRCGSGTTSCSGLGFVLTVSNSVFVMTPFPGCTPLPLAAFGVVDGGNNRCYLSRAAAATAESWSGPDAFGNPCCAAPWIPPILLTYNDAGGPALAANDNVFIPRNAKGFAMPWRAVRKTSGMLANR